MTYKPQFPRVDSTQERGRSSYGSLETVAPKSVRLFEVRIRRNGYDDGGVYWGRHPSNKGVYCATDDKDYRAFIVSTSRYTAARRLSLSDEMLVVSVRPWRKHANAKYIDRLLFSLAAKFHAWETTAKNLEFKNKKYEDAVLSARNEAINKIVEMSRRDEWGAVWQTLRNTINDYEGTWMYDETREIAYRAAWGVGMALVAWDDAQELMSADMGLVKFLAEVQDPRAVLLLPARVAMQEETS